MIADLNADGIVDSERLKSSVKMERQGRQLVSPFNTRTLSCSPSVTVFLRRVRVRNRV